ncbi:MAG: hypothetical protein ACI4RR_06175 [Eubacterium sp.]
MKSTKLNYIKTAFASFFTAFSLSCCIYVLVKYYDEFIYATAGSYFVTNIFNEPLKIFLFKVLTIVTGLACLISVIVKICKKNKADIYPRLLIVGGILFAVLPAVSYYTVSRFTGNLLVQSVTGIAIIANTVFTMASVCFFALAITDYIFSVFYTEKAYAAVNASAFFAGVIFGIGLAWLLSTILNSLYGLNIIFVLFGIITAVLSFVSALLIKANKGKRG